MSNGPDNLIATLKLNSKLCRWRNIAMLLAFLVFLLACGRFLGSKIDLSGSYSKGKDYIAKVEIEGPILKNEFRSSVLKKLLEDPNVKAVLLIINSPGGEIVSSEVLFKELRDIAIKKPAVTLMESVAASGGYMISLASDHIIAHNGTITGSIGVIMESPEITELTSKLGVKFNTYKSSPLKGSPSPFEKSTPSVDKVIKDSILDSHNFFVDLVKSRRGKKLDKSSFNIAFDGRIFTGRQAFRIGLVDQVGFADDAMKYLQSRGVDTKNLPIEKIELEEKEEKSLFEKIVGENLNSASSKIERYFLQYKSRIMVLAR